MLRATVLPVIEADFDYRGAIATIGETLTGETTILEVLGDMTIRAFGGITPEEGEDAVTDDPEPSPVPAPMITPPSVQVIHPPIEEVFTVPEMPLEIVYLLSRPEPEPEPMPTPTPVSAPQEPDAVAVFLAQQERFSDHALPANAAIYYAPLDLDFVAPLAGRVSSPFGFRWHPIRGEVRFHFGTDIAADTGVPFVAFADGRVVQARENDSWGKYILLYHGDGIYTRYAHASAKYVSAGDTVERGQRIGRVGATGGATGPHLHFELRVNGMYRNPEFHMNFAA